jgi:transcription initiation factor TFIIIB Brf1 subunit/transcription initiation factor TFIIB
MTYQWQTQRLQTEIGGPQKQYIIKQKIKMYQLRKWKMENDIQGQTCSLLF